MTPDQEEVDSMTLIEKRLDDWFVKQSQSSFQFAGNVKKRWESLQTDVNRAHTEFGDLNIAKSSDGVLTGVVLCESNANTIRRIFVRCFTEISPTFCLER